jgi:Na+-transporting methylmalonyl-CoA/oxaloacetate decarboxylase gamma subunit
MKISFALVLGWLGRLLSTLSKMLALSISGLAVGWLMGLSVAPNVQNVITSVLALVVGIMSILAGTKIPEKQRDDTKADKANPVEDERSAQATQAKLVKANSPATSSPAESSLTESAQRIAIGSLWPVAGFMAGLMVGASGGLLARTNSLLGPNPDLQARYWELDSARKARLTDKLLWMTYGLGRPVEVTKPKKPEIKYVYINKPNRRLDKRRVSGRKSENPVVVTRATEKQEVAQDIPSSLPKRMESVFFGSKAAEFCIRTSDTPPDELRSEIKQFTEYLLEKADSLSAEDKRKVNGWYMELPNATNDRIKQIHLELCRQNK